MEARARKGGGAERRVNGEGEGEGAGGGRGGEGGGEATADGTRGKGVVMLGVGRKVGSRNGSRGCCATINTPRDATRHISLAPTLLLSTLFTHFLSFSLSPPLCRFSVSVPLPFSFQRSRRSIAVSLTS